MGSASSSNWNVNIAGVVGATGPEGATGPSVLPGGNDGQILFNDDGAINGTNLYYIGGINEDGEAFASLGINESVPTVELEVSGKAKIKTMDQAGALDIYPVVVDGLGNELKWKPKLELVHESFNGNGSASVYQLAHAPVSKEYLIIAVDGLIRDPSTYNLNGTTLSFPNDPPNGTIDIRNIII
jgi:hypothetical protein